MKQLTGVKKKNNCINTAASFLEKETQAEPVGKGAKRETGWVDVPTERLMIHSAKSPTGALGERGPTGAKLGLIAHCYR